MDRKRLTDILRNGHADNFIKNWNATQAAEDFKPLPAGEYVARILSGELGTSKTNATPGYKLTFQVLEGEFIDRRFWHDIWLSEAALPMAKRDLRKLGISSPDQLELSLPLGIRVRAKLALRVEDDGTEYNRVRSFEVIGIDPPDVDPFAPELAPVPNGLSGIRPPNGTTGADSNSPDDDGTLGGDESGDTSFDPSKFTADDAGGA